MYKLYEEVGADSLDVMLKPSHSNTVLYPDINTPNKNEGLRLMEIQAKFKEMFDLMSKIRSMAEMSLEVQGIISQEQDRTSSEDSENVDSYLALIDLKERFQFLNQILATLEKEFMLLADEILDSVPEEVEDETEEEETEEVVEETEEDTEDNLEADLNDMEETTESKIVEGEGIEDVTDEWDGIEDVTGEGYVNIYMGDKCVFSVRCSSDREAESLADQLFAVRMFDDWTYTKRPMSKVIKESEKKEFKKNESVITEQSKPKLVGRSDGKNGMIVRVYKDYEWDEYVCKMWENGKRNEDADYFTDDLEDALNTAKAMVGIKLGESVKLIEREQRHLKSCASGIKDKMTTKQIDSVIKVYFNKYKSDMNCTLTEFKKSVKAFMKSKKESKTFIRESTRVITGKEFRDLWIKYNLGLLIHILPKDKDEKTATLGDYAPRFLGKFKTSIMRYGEQGDDLSSMYKFMKDNADKHPSEALDYANESKKYKLKSLIESTDLNEKAQSKHVEKCASDLAPDKMSVADMVTMIQSYYDENDIGGSFSDFKKAVLTSLKSKK